MKPHLIHFSIAAVLSVVALVSYGAWYAVVAARSVSVANVQSTIDTQKETQSRIASARVALAEVETDEQSMQTYFISETGVVSFINLLEEGGKIQGSAVSVLSVAKSAMIGRPALLFTLSITGSFDAVMRTVGSIEYAPYNLSISEFSLVQNDAHQWQADTKLLVVSSESPSAATSSVKATTP